MIEYISIIIYQDIVSFMSTFVFLVLLLIIILKINYFINNLFLILLF